MGGWGGRGARGSSHDNELNHKGVGGMLMSRSTKKRQSPQAKKNQAVAKDDTQPADNIERLDEQRRTVVRKGQRKVQN